MATLEDLLSGICMGCDNPMSELPEHVDARPDDPGVIASDCLVHLYCELCQVHMCIALGPKEESGMRTTQPRCIGIHPQSDGPIAAVTQCAGCGHHLCGFHARYHKCPNDHPHAPMGAR